MRPGTAADAGSVHRLLLAAFPTAAEADLVRRLDAAGDTVLSLVAEDGDQLVGCLLASRMAVTADGQELRAVGLGPVAVEPDRQRQAIGARLCQAALERARSEGEEIMFVLGDPAYYRRFGFTAEAAAPFASPYAGPYFQACWLAAPRPVGAGRADYAPAFAELEEEQ